MRVLIAPVFHGHTGLLHVKPGRKMSMREVSDALKAVKGIAVTASARAAPTPVEIAERPGLCGRERRAGRRRRDDFWIWFAGGDLPHARRQKRRVLPAC